MKTVRDLIEGSAGKFDRMRSLVVDASNAAWALERKFTGSEDFGFSADDMGTEQYRKLKKLIGQFATMANKTLDTFNDLSDVAKGHEEP